MQEPEPGKRNHTHPVEVITLHIPVDTLKAIKKVAVEQDVPYEALIKYYIGRGLREDLARMMYDRVLEQIPEVLARHVDSEEEIALIIKEIRAETVL